MKKGKLTMLITLGIICFFLVSTMYMQFNTVSKTDIESIKNLREADLRKEIATWKTKLEETQKQYDDTISKKQEYETSIEDNEKTTKLLEEDLEEARMALGLTDVTGEGIIITLSDNEFKGIVADDLLELINELRIAGAEAISINEERVVINTYIADIDYRYIIINDQRISSPYIVKAIGNQGYLESGLTAKQYGYIDNMKALGKTASLERVNDITITKYEGPKITLSNVIEENK